MTDTDKTDVNLLAEKQITKVYVVIREITGLRTVDSMNFVLGAFASEKGAQDFAARQHKLNRLSRSAIYLDVSIRHTIREMVVTP